MKSISTLLILTLLYCPNVLSAQSLTEWEAREKQRVEDKMLENALRNLQQNASPITMGSENIPETMPSMIDADDDGMDDDWEVANGLNPADPRDALGDIDGDKIRNLFEFQLSTNPQDVADPVTLDLSPADGIPAIDQAMADADGGLVVVRLSEGLYTGQAIHFFNNDSRFMLQGGWNADFTEHDPSLYPAVLEDNGEEPIYLGQSSGANNIANSHWVVEGVQTTAIDNFGLSGAIQCVYRAGVATVSFLDVVSIENTHIGSSLLAWAPNGRVDFRFFRSVFANCGRSGLYIQTTSGCQPNFYLNNVTIHNPNATNEGFDGLVNDIESFQTNYFTNVINWGNPAGTIGYNPFQPEETSFSFFNCNFDGIDPAYVIIDSAAVINADPLFNDVEANDFSLQQGSPCIDAGLDVGLSFLGAAPEMGAVEYVPTCSTTNAVILVNACGPYEYNGTLYFSGVMVSDTFSSVGGCDSIITLDLTVEIFNINIMATGGTLSAEVQGDLPEYQFQWIDCSTSMDIPGETGPEFTPLVSGEYALRVTSPNCQEASDCISVVVSSVTNLSNLAAAKLFPNPATQQVTIDLGQQVDEAILYLRTVTGQKVMEIELTNQQLIQLPLEGLARGVYLAQLVTETGVKVLPFTKD